MTEIVRHTEATAVEEERHLDAADAEMARHIANASTVEERQAEVEVVRQKARRSLLMFGCLVAAVVLGALGIAGLSARVAAQNGDRINELAAQLADAKGALAKVTQVDDADAARVAAVDKCTVVLQTFVRDSNRKITVGTAQLSIYFAKVISAGRTVEASSVLVDDVQVGIDEYNMAVDRISAWQRLPADRQLPCPTVKP